MRQRPCSCWAPTSLQSKSINLLGSLIFALQLFIWLIRDKSVSINFFQLLISILISYHFEVFRWIGIVCMSKIAAYFASCPFPKIPISGFCLVHGRFYSIPFQSSLLRKKATKCRFSLELWSLEILQIMGSVAICQSWPFNMESIKRKNIIMNG